jgi:hypothetical protein
MSPSGAASPERPQRQSAAVLPPLRRAVAWLSVATAAAVAAGVLLQAFSIAAYIRGAGVAARDLHASVGYTTHILEIVVVVAALVGFWGAWRKLGLAFLLPLVGTLQLLLIGDTDRHGSWINGLHGFLALVVLLLAIAIAWEGARSLRPAGRHQRAQDAALER